MAQPSAVENVSWLRKFYVKLQTNRWANKKIRAVTIFSFTSPVCSKIEIVFYSFQISCPRIVSAFEYVRVKRCPRSRIIQNYLSACRRPTTTRSFDCSQVYKIARMVIYFQIIMNYFSFYPGPSATRSFQAIVFKWDEKIKK